VPSKVTSGDLSAKITTPSSLNELNRIFFYHVSRRSDLFLVQTDLKGVFCLRLAVGAERTESKHIEAAFSAFKEEASRAMEEWKRSRIAML